MSEVMKYTLAVDTDVSGALSGVKQLQGALNGVKFPASFTADMIKDFDKLKNSLTKFKDIASKSSFSKVDLKNLEKLQSEIDSTFSHISNSFSELNGKSFYLDADLTKIKEARAEVEQLKADIQNKLNNIKIDIGSSTNGKDALSMNGLISGMERGVKSSKVLSAAMKEVGQSVQVGNFQAAGKQLEVIIGKAGELKGASTGLLSFFQQLGVISLDKPAKDLAKTAEGTEKLKEAFKAILPFFTEDEKAIQKVSAALDEATKKQKALEQAGQKNAEDYAAKQAASVDKLKDSTHQATQAQKEYAASVSETQNQIKQLQSSTQYFFSLRNMLNLLKRGLHEAVQTIKDLDAAMTETAVVTRYSVGDMWAKLPEYTANANKLGATIQDMYESTTLYYQQGLNTQQSMAIASETMKMARIAGLEAKDATDMMTAALRGFNMELNEASATRINDVYSNLAAKTASDTEEIGKAMQRTASIAHSAGMSFEGTAAFLAQAVETTREPAENIGTAMKTIIARFQEMKKNPLEISEVEGEEVSFNKVDAALQSIGVSLKDTNGQFRELDQVFLDISQKWDSLSQTQQRYIATIAAGSRQQSRFIAMMGDYDRTVELMNYANNSSGASAEQFGKTLESLEAKINKFQNAWQQFLMGILNDTWTKRLVDGGTLVLNTVNKIINALSFNGKLSLVKSALSVFTAFTALKYTGRFANKMIGGLGGMIDPTSSFGLGFKQGGIKSNNNQAKAISDPIVQAINRIYNIVNKNAVPKENLKNTFADKSYYRSFKDQQQAFRQTVKNRGTVGEAFDTFKGLDKKQVATILNNNTGMERQLQRSVNKYIENLNIEPATKKLVSKSIPGMFNAFKNDPKMSGEQFLKAFRLDQLGKQLMLGGAKAEGQALVDMHNKFWTDRKDNWFKSISDLTGKEFTEKDHRQQMKENAAYKRNFENYQKRGQETYNQRFGSAGGQKIDDPKLLDKMAQGASAVGAAFSTAGMAITSFGMALSNAGLETVGGLLTKIGTGISGVGNIIASGAMAVSVAMEAGSAAILGFLGAAWPFVAAIAAIVGVAILLDKAIVTNKEALNAAADAATAASEAYDAAKQSASELADAIEQIRATQASFDGLVAGTAEFNDQLITANKQIYELIDKYPMLMEAGKNYITTDKNGLMHISEEGLKAVEEYQKTLQSRASAVDLIQTSDLNLLEGQQQAEDLRKRKLKMSDEEYARNQRDADLLEQRAKTQQEMARLNAIQTILTGKNIKDNQKLATIFADQYETQRKSVEASMTTDKHAIRQQYADYHGYTYERSSGKIKDQNDNEVNFEDSVIKDEMIEATVLLNFEADAESLNSTLDHIDSTFASSLEDTFENSSSFITDVLTKNIDTDEDLLKEVLANKQHFQDLVNNLSNEEIAAILGANAADITDANIDQYKTDVINKLTQNSQDIVDAQVDAYANLGSMVARAQGYTIDELNKTMLINGRHQKINMDEINQYIKQFTAEQVHSLANIGDLLEKNAGPDAMKEYIGHMTDIYSKINQSQIGNIDLKNREKWFNADGSISTVSGTSGEFGAEGKIGIAFTPYLQTGTGTPKKLTSEEYNKYLEGIVEEAKGNADEILRLDKERYSIIAEVSPDVTKDKHYQETARTMHDLEDLRFGAQEIQGIFEKADLTSAIGQLKTYTDLANGSYEATRELGEGLMSLPSSANLVGRAFDEFIEGGEWADIAENIDKIQNSFGQIDAAGIMSAAKESNQLNTLLDSGIVSAGGLAMALQGVADGKLAINDVNQTVLELLSSLTRVEDEALKAHDIITNFDAGIDYGEAEDFAKENAKKVKEFWDNGEYGNPQLQNYIKLAAGEERWNKALEKNKGDLEATEKALKKYVTTFEDGFGSVIDQLVSGQGIDGNTLSKNISQALENGEIDKTLADKFSKIVPRIEGDNFLFSGLNETATELTTEEFKTYLEKIYGVSTEYADLIFEYFANMSPDFKQELTKNDFAETVQSDSFKETHFNKETGQYVFSDAEMEAYALARGLEDVGEAYAEIAPLLNTTVENLENAQMNWLDKNGQRFELSGEKANSETLDSYLNKYFGGVDIKSFLSNAAYKDGDKIELGNVIADAVARGADERQGAQIAWETAQQYGGNGEFYYEGQLVKLEDFANFDEFYEHLSELQETSQWVDIGYAIAQGMEKYQYDKDHPDEQTPKEASVDTTTPGKKDSEYDNAYAEGLAKNKEDVRGIVDGILNLWNSRNPNVEDPKVQALEKSAEKTGSVLDRLGSVLNTSINEKTGYTSEEKTSSSEQAGENLNAGSQSLNEAASQLLSGIESLSTAGESLNTAATNLTSAAAILATSQPQSSGTSGGVPDNVSGHQSSVSGAIVIDNSAALESLDEVYNKATETASKINEGATFTIKTPGLTNLTKAANAAKKVSDNTGQKDISLNTSISGASAESIDTLKASVKEFTGLGNHTVTLTTTLKGATVSSIENIVAAINSFHLKTDHTVTLKTIKETINKDNATGAHNHGYASAPSFGSAAGGYGQVGPKGKGGLTLTGELGYEIAWIPSENRSMILGANGPQMVNLPGDTVVWTHEQSEKILKQKAIPAGSHFRVSKSGSSSGSGGSKGKSGGSGSSGGSSSSKSSSSSAKENYFSIEEIVRFNIDQKIAKVTAEIDKRTKSIEKTLTKIGTTYNQIVASTKEQVTALQGVKDYNAQLLASYQRQLADYRSKQTVVSYTDNAGKSQEQKINIASYLNADGTANVSAIRAAGSSAIQEAIYKEINSAKSLVDGINNAQKAIKDAEDQMAELGKKISEAFYQWENELTEVYDLTQRIASATSFTDRFTSQIELELSKLNVGFGETAQAIENTRIVLTRSNLTIQEQIKNQQQMINARQRELEAALSYEDEKNKLEKFIRQTNVDDATKAANIEWAQNLLSGAQLGSKYIKDVFKDLDGSIQYTIDWEQFNADNEANPYSKDTYEAIKKYLEDVNNAATEFNNSIKDQTDFIKQTYDALKEYQSFVADMEDTLIESYEKQIQTTIDNAKQLSESISNSLKNLLDEVKRKLDERRKQEDNVKTERDISQKQQRLAALRANTAGGNQVEIAKLEKEIADAQQSYGRTLEDQLIDRLQQQGDEAAQQRERQIELAEAANEISAANNKELIDLWLKDPETYKEKIKAAWLEAQGYDEKGEAGQYVLNQGFESQFTQLVTAVEQSGFNNLKAPFTAIEGNTNTLVSLLQQLTHEQIGISDESSKAFGSVADVTYRNTGTFKDGSNSTSNMGGMTLVSSNPKKANSGITLGKDSYVKKNAEYDESGNIKSYGQVIDSNTGITYDFAYDKNTGKNVYLDTSEVSGKNSLGGLNMSKSEDAIYVGQVFDVASQGAGQNQKYFVKSITPVKGKNGYTVTYEYTSRGGGKYRWSDSFYGDQLAFNDNTLSGVSDYVNSRQLLDVLNPADNKWYLLYKTLGGMNANEKDATYAVAGTGDANRLSKYSVSLNDLEWVSDKTGNYFKFKKWVGVGQKFKSGGLNTFTGPAWLDGTPSKPELVLNAKDTQNFLALRDVLSNVMKSASTVSNSYGGDIMYDINIHVDKIEKDYDVDRVVDKVKKEITKGAGYRNVTQVRNFR